MNCKIVKLDTLKKPRIKEKNNIFAPLTGEIFYGAIHEYPKVGKVFFVGGSGDYSMRTSIVKSIYVHGTGRDKLVLPSTFPKALELDFTNLKMKPGDMLLATCNSVYKVYDIT